MIIALLMTDRKCIEGEDNNIDCGIIHSTLRDTEVRLKLHDCATLDLVPWTARALMATFAAEIRKVSRP